MMYVKYIIFNLLLISSIAWGDSSQCIQKIWEKILSEEFVKRDFLVHDGYYTKKKIREMIFKATHSNHGSKHIKALTEENAKKLSFKVAQYLPGKNVKKLENIALRSTNATIIPRDKNNFWKIYRFKNIIGYDQGEATRWIRVEYSSGVYHGHPMHISRVRKYLKKALP